MANTGNIFPQTGENNAGIGATAWTNPGNVVSDNGTDATCNAAASSQYLISRNFPLSSVPVNATVDGILVRAEVSEHSTATEPLRAQLQDAGGVLFGSPKSTSNQGSISGTAKAVYTWGGIADLWGATITPAILHDPDFGVRHWFVTAHDVRIDYTTIQVEFTNATYDIAASTDAALALSLSKGIVASAASETDAALALEWGESATEVQIGLATEADAALSLSFYKSMGFGSTVEVDAAINSAVAKYFAVGISSEADSAPLVVNQDGGNMAAATDQQVQTYVNERLRVRAEQFRAINLAMTDDKIAITDVYDACEPAVSATWDDERTDGPPRLLTAQDVLVYNTILALWPKFRDGTATAQDVADFAANWPTFQTACVRAL